MKGDIEERAVKLAEYLTENNSTVRDAAKVFGISKSTVHKDITERLEKINKSLYLKARGVLDKNKAERHLRGGMATKNKHAKRKKARS